MTEPTPIRPTEEPLPIDFEQEVDEEPTEEPDETLDLDSPPPPLPPPPTPTVGDDVANMAVLITQVAKDFRIKPDLAFKLLELTLNYKLAMRQLSSPPPSFIPPYPTMPDTEETNDGDEESS